MRLSRLPPGRADSTERGHRPWAEAAARLTLVLSRWRHGQLSSTWKSSCDPRAAKLKLIKVTRVRSSLHGLDGRAMHMRDHVKGHPCATDEILVARGHTYTGGKAGGAALHTEIPQKHAASFMIYQCISRDVSRSESGRFCKSLLYKNHRQQEEKEANRMSINVHGYTPSIKSPNTKAIIRVS